MDANWYFSGQGKLKVAPIVNGIRGAYRWVGNVPDFKPTFEVSKIEHKESYSGQRLTDKTIITETKAAFSATLESWNAANMALAVRGSVERIAGGSVTDELSPADLKVGEEWSLNFGGTSAVVITDNAGLPVDAADFQVDNVYGTVVILGDLGAYDLPLKAAYTYGASEAVPFFTKAASEVAILFEGVNTADGNRPVRVEIYKVALDPTKELGLISDELGQFVIEGSALMDSTKGDDPTMGRFGRMIYLPQTP